MLPGSNTDRRFGSGQGSSQNIVDSTKDKKEAGHWGNGEDNKESKIRPKDGKETSYVSNEEVNKQTQVAEKRSELVCRNAMEKKRHHQQQSHECMKR